MNQTPLRAIHVTTSVSRLGGGLFESVRHLSKETAKNGVQIEVLGLQDQYSGEDQQRWAPLPIRIFPIAGPQRFGYAPALTRYLTGSRTDLVHLHGVWQYPSVAVLRWARATGLPYMVSAHGMLEPWSLQRSRFKKAIVSWLYQNTCLRKAACLRATAESEMESFRQLGLKNPIALIANGVPVPDCLENQKSEIGNRKLKRALFISRIHPKKGLLDLVRAWQQVKKAESGKRKAESDGQQSAGGNPISGLRPPISGQWELVIVGPDEGGHLGQVMALVKELGLQDSIRYGGEVWDDAGKWKCYQEADLFVLPSYSENFGLVIAEALGCGVPVITTKATPWQDLETQRCGWWIDTGVEAVAAALLRAMAIPAEELQAMGMHGRELVQRKYSWEPIGKQMAETYEWLAGRGPKPECVQSKT